VGASCHAYNHAVYHTMFIFIQRLVWEANDDQTLLVLRESVTVVCGCFDRSVACYGTVPTIYTPKMAC